MSASTGESDPVEGEGPRDGAELDGSRRAYVRFATMCRVDYEAGGRSTFSFTRDISSHGMFLRDAKHLVEGDARTFHM